MKNAIEQVLRGYLSGDLAFEEFRERLVPLTWDLTPEDQDSDSELGREIDLVLGEAGHASWTQDAVRKGLKQALAKHEGRLRRERSETFRAGRGRVKT